MGKIKWYLIQLTLLRHRKKTASIYEDDCPYPLLAPTMTTLLQQQARGISSGSS